MNPQGSSIINTSQYESMTERIESVKSCEQLQQVGAEIIASLNAETAAITAQFDKVFPLVALLTAPTSPDAVIDWIKGLIDNLITPLAKPAITYPTQVAARTVAITDLIDAINKKASEFQECSITLPTP
jgi:hypothetical protein